MAVLGYYSVDLVFVIGSTLLWYKHGSLCWLQLADVEDWVKLAHPIRQVGQLISVATPASADLKGANPAGG